ncbi:MAG: RNA polymerase sigma-54 factor [Actinobacteria bacterium HGW-Actinobacteria-7]|nr:MAG: RNA polymerase sigma-54 factor [Actinobacteria bacterium HGW-Actinobacteria-7]
MELQQRPELRQKMTLSPQVYQGLAILAMPVAELQQMVEAEMLENPVLEVDETDSEPAEGEEPLEEREDERSWDEWLEMYDDLDQIEPTSPRDPNAEQANTEEFVGGVQTFDDYLLGQLTLLDISPAVSHAAKAVVGSLDVDGFFRGSLEEIATLVGESVDVAKAGLEAIQQLDPPGVGARDLAEALCLQMEFLGIDEPRLTRIIKDHLDDVASNHFKRVARALRVDEDEVRRLVEILRILNPRPAGAFSPGPSPGYIVPDVTVRRFDEDWLIIPNNEALPALRVSPRYRSMLRSGSNADDETRRYLKDKIRSAESFIRNVDRRKDTVTRITEIVLEVQRDFFEDGRGPLRPLRLEDVAVEIGVHLSTVSRGVTGKYMATPYGLFELKYFFSGGYRTSTGMDVASTSIKQRLRELVKDEDASKPLSDQRLAELLTAEGVTVARRTVAKYREELGIEPSWARRRR